MDICRFLQWTKFRGQSKLEGRGRKAWWGKKTMWHNHKGDSVFVTHFYLFWT